VKRNSSPTQDHGKHASVGHKERIHGHLRKSDILSTITTTNEGGVSGCTYR